MNIPQELTDKIIDRIWDADDSPSHTATKVASLVSRAWVERSQHHLFHDIQFTAFGPLLTRWCDTVSPGPNGVSRHVRSLTIRARGMDGQWVDEESLERGFPFFGSFRNVRVLRVYNWNVEAFPLEILTRCFTSFAGSVRVLQWHPYEQISHESWTHIIRSFPLIDSLLLHPNYFPTGLLSNTPPDPARKKLVLSSVVVPRCFAWGAGSLRFQEIYIGCGATMTLETIISIVSRDADRLEILSIAGTRNSQTFSVCSSLVLNSLFL